MTSFLEPAALHQTRFRTPGVSPDARGVVVGQKGVCVFPSLDRAVAFFRAYGEEGSLDELLSSLSIQRVISSLRTREIMVSVLADSSYRMDRVASVARLAGGEVFTGTQRHFVRYRDARSPLGYDVLELANVKADVVLYADSYQQAYNVERDVPFKELVLKLQPYVVPTPGKQSFARLFVTAEVGLGHALVGYLFRWRVKAKVALCEWPSQSAFDDGPKRLFVFEIEEPPARVVTLLRSLPGARVFEPVTATVGVEVGHRHPIALDSCGSLFSSASLTLFSGGAGVTTVEPMPPFAPVRTLVKSHVDLENAKMFVAKPGAPMVRPVELSLTLAPTQLPWRRVVASIVPIEARAQLARLFYVLPPRTLGALRMAITERAIYLLDPGGIEGVPLGRFYSQVAERIYVPAGMALVPAVSSGVLEELVQGRGQGHVFFEPGHEGPTVVSETAFAGVSRQVLREVAGTQVHADAPDRVDPPLPMLSYGPETRFPLWGALGKDEPKAG